MAQIKFANNVSTQLIKPVAADDSTIEVRSFSQGLVWPDISTAGDYFLIVIDDASTSTWEILKCTKVEINDTTTILTVERGLEGTTPSAFSAGSVVENRLTAGTLNMFSEEFPTVVEIDRGGTGATTAEEARTNLGVPSEVKLTSEVARLDQKITDNIPPAATTSVRGTTTLSSAVDSVSEAMAATPKAVKTVYDVAVSAKSNADTVDARVTDEVNTLTANIEAVQNSCAPTSHASSSTTYGLGSNLNYGHVRGDGKTTDVISGEIVVKDVLFNNLISLTDSGALGKAKYIRDAQSFNIDTADFDLIVIYGVNSEHHAGTYPNRREFIYVRQLYYLRTSSTAIGNRMQVAFGYSANIMWRRYYNSGSWSSWVKVIDETDLATLSTPGIVKPGTGTSVAGDGTLNVDTASTSQKGIVQLSSATNSESELVAATSKAVKVAYDKAVEASNKAGLPLGHIFAWPFSTAPDGCIILNGSTYDRTLYADLFTYVKSKGWTKTEAEWQDIAQANNGFCPWYSEGDGSTNFRTPKFAPYQKIALASGDAGKYYEAGLPNIEGSTDMYGGYSAPTGAFYRDTTLAGEGFNSAGSDSNIVLDASRSNPIYGNSTTVQPESNDWIICAVAFGTATNVGSVDVANVMSAVGQIQANPNLQGTAHIVKTWKSTDGHSWYRKWSDGFIEQGGFIVTGASKTVSFFINFTDNLPHVNLGLVTNRSESSYDSECYPTALTRTSFTVSNLTPRNTATGAGAYWYACGY